jgi:hypothetical protein
VTQQSLKDYGEVVTQGHGSQSWPVVLKVGELTFLLNPMAGDTPQFLTGGTRPLC